MRYNFYIRDQGASLEIEDTVTQISYYYIFAPDTHIEYYSTSFKRNYKILTTNERTNFIFNFQKMQVISYPNTMFGKIITVDSYDKNHIIASTAAGGGKWNIHNGQMIFTLPYFKNSYKIENILFCTNLETLWIFNYSTGKLIRNVIIPFFARNSFYEWYHAYNFIFCYAYKNSHHNLKEIVYKIDTRYLIYLKQYAIVLSKLFWKLTLSKKSLPEINKHILSFLLF